MKVGRIRLRAAEALDSVRQRCHGMAVLQAAWVLMSADAACRIAVECEGCEPGRESGEGNGCLYLRSLRVGLLAAVAVSFSPAHLGSPRNQSPTCAVKVAGPCSWRGECKLVLGKWRPSVMAGWRIHSAPQAKLLQPSRFLPPATMPTPSH